MSQNWNLTKIDQAEKVKAMIVLKLPGGVHLTVVSTPTETLVLSETDPSNTELELGHHMEPEDRKRIFGDFHDGLLIKRTL